MEISAGWAVVWTCTTIFLLLSGGINAFLHTEADNSKNTVLEGVGIVFCSIQSFASIVTFIALIIILTE
jgi:hypothetical protein